MRAGVSSESFLKTSENVLNKKVLTTALLATFAGAAHAQSSVTLYGIIDAGISYANHSGANSQKIFKYDDGVAQGSRWGLRGSEDLGGGLKAIFVLENGFNSGNGTASQGGALFGRQAYVGLSKDNIGAVTFGRQYSLSTDVLGSFSTGSNTVAGNYAYHINDIDQLTSSRINNSVKFSSANFYGFTFGALYGFSNQADGFANNRVYSAGASYSFAGFNFGAGYLQLNNNAGAVSQGTINGGGAVTLDNTFFATRQQTWGAGANYTLGPATFGLVYTQTNLQDLVGFGSGGGSQSFGAPDSAHFQNFEANARYALTPALSIAGSYTYTKASLAATNPHFNQVNLQTDYALSKRTDVYLQAEYVTTNENAVVNPIINGLSAPSATSNQVAVTGGIRHRF